MNLRRKVEESFDSIKSVNEMLGFMTDGSKKMEPIDWACYISEYQTIVECKALLNHYNETFPGTDLEDLERELNPILEAHRSGLIEILSSIK